MKANDSVLVLLFLSVLLLRKQFCKQMVLVLVFLVSQDALEVMYVGEWSLSDLSDVTLVSDDTNWILYWCDSGKWGYYDDHDAHNERWENIKEVKIVKEMKIVNQMKIVKEVKLVKEVKIVKEVKTVKEVKSDSL